MENLIDEKTRRKYRYKTVSQFNYQREKIYQNYLIHETIKRFNFVVDYFNVNVLLFDNICLYN